MIRIPGVQIIDRALFRELIATFALSLGVMTLALFLQQMLRFSDIFLKTGIPFSYITRFLLYVLPFFLVLTVPIGVLIASILTFGRLSAEREYGAMQSAGISPYRLLRPVLLFSLALTGFGLWISLVVQPWSGEALKKQFYDVLKKERNFGLQEGVFNIFFDRVVYIDRIHPPSQLEGVLISDHPPSVGPGTSQDTRIITAQHGGMLMDPATSAIYLRLHNGSIHHLSGERDYQIIRFSSYMVKLGVDDPLQTSPGLFRSRWTMGIKDFRSELSRLSRDRKEEAYRALLLDYHKKWALPSASLIFGLLGAPIGAMIRSTSKFAGFASGVLIVILYYFLFVAAEFLSGSGVLSGSAAAWLPNALMTLLMALLVWKIGRR